MYGGDKSEEAGIAQRAVRSIFERIGDRTESDQIEEDKQQDED